MYIIRVDNQDWVLGDSKGWLATTPLRSMAAIYATLPDAQEALAYYASTYTNITFTICPLNDLGHDLTSSLNRALMQTN